MSSIFIHLLSFSIFFLPKNIQSSPPDYFPNGAIPAKSGYVPVSPTSSLFFAFYEAQQPTSPPSQTPLLLWLEGGPGCSSLLGNFFELGPFIISPQQQPTLLPNPFSWNRLFGLLFIDNPVGAGFSIFTSPADIPRNQSLIAAHLFTALQHFLSSDPSFRTRPVYIVGESYGGKYVPAAGYYILQQNSNVPESKRINLAGVAIGNGLTHPIVQVATYADTAYFTGLVNWLQKKELEELQDEVIGSIHKERWSEAATARSRLLEKLQNMTGLATLMDMRKKRPYETEMVGALLNKEEVKELLGAKKERAWEECSDVVLKVMHEDIMKSTKFMVEELVKKSRVLLYQGMFDLMDGVASAEAWIKEMEWEGLKRFLEAERKVWKVEGEVAGQVQRWGSLTHVVVFRAGHLVPADQRRNSQAMIEDWVLEDALFGDIGNSSEVVVPMLKASF